MNPRELEDKFETFWQLSLTARNSTRYHELLEELVNLSVQAVRDRNIELLEDIAEIMRRHKSQQ
jgi:hypothetical protein